MNKLKIFNLFFHNILKWMQVLIKKTKVDKFWLKGSNFEEIVNKIWLYRLGWTDQRYRDTIFCKNKISQSLVEGKNYPAALYKIPNQRNDSSKVLERWHLQTQPKIINKMTKNWDKNTNKYLGKYIESI